jgi:peptide subunit release factor RF-3
LVVASISAVVFTFVNKLDRPALEPLEILDQIEKEFNLPCYPVNWPIGSGDRFTGIYHRPTKCALRSFVCLPRVRVSGVACPPSVRGNKFN